MRLDELEEVVGTEALVLFLEMFGGTRVYIPTPAKLKANHPLCSPAGYETAMRLSRVAGGCSIDLPLGKGLRKLEILQRRAGGESLDSIARSLKCSRRFVLKVCSDKSEKTEAGMKARRNRQMELF